MKILLMGSQGQVGQALAQTLPAIGELVAWSRADLDLTQVEQIVPQVIAQHPDVIINAAAYTAVDRAESEPALAHQINAEVPKRLAQAASECGAKLIHLSTDYVLDGKKNRPYQTTEVTQPLGIYGQSKRAGELAVQAHCQQHAILRTAWVYGAAGSGNFVKTMLRLSETRDALNVVDDQIGGPTPARSIAQAVLAITGALRGGQTGGTYHFAGAPVTSWAGFARETFARAGRDVTVTGIPTTDYPTPATRPLNSRLDCTTLETDFGIKPADWQAELAHILKVLT